MREQRQKLNTFPQPDPSSQGQLHSVPDSSALPLPSPRGTGWVGSGACGQPLAVPLPPPSSCFPCSSGGPPRGCRASQGPAAAQALHGPQPPSGGSPTYFSARSSTGRCVEMCCAVVFHGLQGGRLLHHGGLYGLMSGLVLRSRSSPSSSDTRVGRAVSTHFPLLLRSSGPVYNTLRLPAAQVGSCLLWQMCETMQVYWERKIFSTSPHPVSVLASSSLLAPLPAPCFFQSPTGLPSKSQHKLCSDR